MKPVLWITTATAIVIFAGYLFLTTGTRILLPDWWEEIEPGMTRGELLKLTRATHRHDSYNPNAYPTPEDPFSTAPRDPIGPILDDRWHFFFFSGIWDDRLSGTIGLRRWTMLLKFADTEPLEDAVLTNVDVVATDWHQEAWTRIRVFLKRLNGP